MELLNYFESVANKIHYDDTLPKLFLDLSKPLQAIVATQDHNIIKQKISNNHYFADADDIVQL